MSAFTLTETLIVLALAVVFVNIGLGDGIAEYERGLSRTDRALVVNALREARAESQNEICSEVSCVYPRNSETGAHGVYVNSSGVTLFEGSNYVGRNVDADESTPFSAPESISGTTEIVFTALSGDSSPASLSVTGRDHHTEIVTVHSDGGITAMTL